MIPDNVEKIIMTKEDYDRQVEQLLIEKLKAEQEIDRLNNIIEGLKGYVEMCINATFNMNNDNYTEGRYNAYCDILDKLEELKEGEE